MDIFEYDMTDVEERYLNNRDHIKTEKGVDKAGTGFIFDIYEPIVLTIFCENSKAPIPISNEPKK